MNEWGIFNDDAADWTAEESVEADFYSKEEAEAAIAERYGADDDHGLFAHEVEEPEDDDDEEEEEADSDEDE